MTVQNIIEIILVGLIIIGAFIVIPLRVWLFYKEYAPVGHLYRCTYKRHVEERTGFLGLNTETREVCLELLKPGQDICFGCGNTILWKKEDFK